MAASWGPFLLFMFHTDDGHNDGVVGPTERSELTEGLERIVDMDRVYGSSFYWADRLDRAGAERLLAGKPNCTLWLPICF